MGRVNEPELESEMEMVGGTSSEGSEGLNERCERGTEPARRVKESEIKVCVIIIMRATCDF